MPPLQQEGGVESLLLSPRLLDLMRAVLAGAKTFKNFALAEGLLIGRCRLLADTFEATNLSLQANSEFLELIAKQSGKLQLGSGASGGQRSGVDDRRLGKKSVNPRELFLGAGNLQGCVLQSKRALAL